MAETHHDEEEHHDEGRHAGGSTATAPKGGESAKKHKETLIVIAIGILGLVLAYLTYRSRSSSSTTSSSTVPSSVAGGGGNTQTLQSEITTLGQGLKTLGTNQAQLAQTLQAQSTANQAAQSGLAAQISALSTQLKSEMASSPQQATAATAGPAPTVPTITIGGTTYKILGLATNIKANVGGGAPVFFGNANAIAQGPTMDVPGNYAYTPASYANLITPLAPGAPRENVTHSAA